MPLYSDSPYSYYSGNSGGLYSSYYGSPLYGSSTVSSSPYAPYSAAYNRSMILPSTSRSVQYSSMSSRYQPNLSTITESPLTARSNYIPLTRIQSPRVYTPSIPSNFITARPARPKLINTADIDVSAASRSGRQQHVEDSRSTNEDLKDIIKDEEKLHVPETDSPFMARADGSKTSHTPRPTIKRNRTVVRLSTMRPQSKGKPKDQKDTTPVPKDSNDDPVEKSETPSSEVLIEVDPVTHTIRRLSIPQAPSFHDICSDISSDKIDDDLNAGELRRRASIIQEQEIEILNELQKSQSGSFQVIHLERSLSQDDNQKGRKSKKGKKLRQKITAKVEIENAPLTPICQVDEEPTVGVSPTVLPKFSFSIDDIEEQHIVKLPKKKVRKNCESHVEKTKDTKDHLIKKEPDIWGELERSKAVSVEIPKKKKDFGQGSKEEPFTALQLKTTVEIGKNTKASILPETTSTSETEKKDDSSGENAPNKPPSETNDNPTIQRGKKAYEEYTPLPNHLPQSDVKLTSEEGKDDHWLNSSTTTSPTQQDFAHLTDVKSLETPGYSFLPDSAAHTNEGAEKPSKPATIFDKKSGTATDTKLSTKFESQRDISKPKVAKERAFKNAEKKMRTSKSEEEKVCGSKFEDLKMKTSKSVDENSFKSEKGKLYPPHSEEDQAKTSKSQSLPPSDFPPSTEVKLFTEKEEETNAQNPPLSSSQSLSSVLKSLTNKKDKTTKPSLETSLSLPSPTDIKSPIEKTKQSVLTAQKLPTDKKDITDLSSMGDKTKNSISETRKLPSTSDKPATDKVKTKIDVESSLTTKAKPTADKVKKSALGISRKVQSLNDADTGQDTKTSTSSSVDNIRITNASNIQMTSEEKPAPPDVENISKRKSLTEMSEIKHGPRLDSLGKEAGSPEKGRKLQKSESGEDFWSQIAIRESVYMNRRRKAKAESFEKPGDASQTQSTESFEKRDESCQVETSLPLVSDSVTNETITEISVLPSRTPSVSSKKVLTAKSLPDSESQTEYETGGVISKGITSDDVKKSQSESAIDKSDQPTNSSRQLPTENPTSAEDNVIATDYATQSQKPTDNKNTQNRSKTKILVDEAAPKLKQKPKPLDTQTVAKKQLPKTQDSPKVKKPMVKKKTSPGKDTKSGPSSPLQNQKSKTKSTAPPTSSKEEAIALPKINAPNCAKSPEDTKTATNSTPATIKSVPVEGPSKIQIKMTTDVPDQQSGDAQYLYDSLDKSTSKQEIQKTSTYLEASKTSTHPLQVAKITRQSFGDSENTYKTDGAKPGKPIKPTGSSPPIKNDATSSVSLTSAAVAEATNSRITAEVSPQQATIKNLPTTSTTPPTTSTASSSREEAPTTARGVLGSGNNLSKFATVSNLAQCLLDVDADLEDYKPSSCDETDSSSDSCTGDGSLSASMKKKNKQLKKKAKEEQANFDPNKKIKIDPKKKCYVKEEAPRYPLVATPRPLWRREKVVYEESSTSSSEETDSESEYSTTSDDGEDDLSQKDPAVRMSTCSNDSGFDGGTAPSSSKKALETSYTYLQFQKSGRITAPATTIPRFKKYSVEDFHFLAVLGKGSFGKVLLAELRNTDYYYAVKCLKKDVVLEDDDVECTLIERKVLALGTKHPYLCHLFCTFQTESHLFFVMEYLNGGDLMFHIQESGRFPEDRARFYGAEIISGLKFLHKKGIIYRDLKLDNVLLDFDGHVRIADFGMCKLQIYLDKTADSFCGTPDYMAPEIIKGDKYNQNVDWWSFGVLLYEMLIGQSPFSGCDEDELFWSICNEIPWFPVYITQEATSILKGLLEKDYTKRVGSHFSPAGDVCDHVFFRSIDWGLLEKRQLPPPFKPHVKHPLDTQYFDRAFTRERVRLTPIDKEILQSMDQAQFQGFSYTNPNATLD